MQHFPMKSVTLGPSFESTEEPDNHPLSDFKIHMLVELEFDSLGYSPFDRIADSNTTTSNNTVEGDSIKSAPLTVCFEPDKVKPPLFQREIDKIVISYKEELIDVCESMQFFFFLLYTNAYTLNNIDHFGQ
jgi:hypothetical protein